MSSIRTVLIQTTLINIQKELGQLEHCLNNIPDSSAYKHHTKNLVEERLKLVNKITYISFKKSLLSLI
jgi:hypothetical protein